jgi:hypothetical protein
MASLGYGLAAAAMGVMGASFPAHGAQATNRQDSPRTTIVIDIDDTLCVTDYRCVIFGIGTDDSRPLDEAARTLRLLAEKYDILYLTARPASVSHRTRRWLKAHDFPPGPIIGSRTLIDVIFQSDYKKRVLTRLRKQHVGMLIGIGDRPWDSRAYRASGMIPVVVNPCPGGKFHRNDLIFKTWRSVGIFFEKNEPLLMDPHRLANTINTGGLTMLLPDRDRRRAR